MAAKPKWPSLQEQLESIKVAPGSPLEKMIKNNQDFHLLQSEEANDDVGLPLWIRVFWRKGHPDVPHPTVNPGAGYPDVLYSIYAWMIAHPDQTWGSQTGPKGKKGGKP